MELKACTLWVGAPQKHESGLVEMAGTRSGFCFPGRTAVAQLVQAFAGEWKGRRFDAQPEHKRSVSPLARHFKTPSTRRIIGVSGRVSENIGTLALFTPCLD